MSLEASNNIEKVRLWRKMVGKKQKIAGTFIRPDTFTGKDSVETGELISP
jgi:hypothetical protein